MGERTRRLRKLEIKLGFLLKIVIHLLLFILKVIDEDIAIPGLSRPEEPGGHVTSVMMDRSGDVKILTSGKGDRSVISDSYFFVLIDVSFAHDRLIITNRAKTRTGHYCL